MEKIIDYDCKFAILLLKPDCLQRGLVNEALNRVYNQSKLTLVAYDTKRFSQEEINIFYRQCVGEVFFRGLSEHLKSGTSKSFCSMTKMLWAYWIKLLDIQTHD